MQTDFPLPIAAILYSPTDQVENLMLLAARTLTEQGIQIAGVLQHDVGAAEGDPCGMEMEDLTSGERFSLSQELGSGSEACRLDPASLAHAAISVRAAVENGADLIFMNKFGAQEAAGSGLRAEMALVATSGIPLLTAVGGRFLSEWQAFTGGESTLLEPKLESILGWWNNLHPRI